MSQQDLIAPGPAAAKPSRRREMDAYLTPARATAQLLMHCPELRGQTLLDCACGDGRMARQILEAPASMQRRFARVHLNDLDIGRLTLARHAIEPMEGVSTWHSQRDAADPSLYVPAPDAMVTNPPFAHAGAIAHQALQRTLHVVALLVRATWLEPCAASPKAPRGDRRWLTRIPPSRLIVLGRVSFTGTGSDSAGYVWAIWLRDDPRGPWQRGSIAVADGDAGQLALLGASHAG